jgi:hypothetical protein
VLIKVKYIIDHCVLCASAWKALPYQIKHYGSIT